MTEYIYEIRKCDCTQFNGFGFKHLQKTAQKFIQIWNYSLLTSIILVLVVLIIYNLVFKCYQIYALYFLDFYLSK